MAKEIDEAIRDSFLSVNELDSNYEAPANMTDGLFAIARAIDRTASALLKLGTADAATPMGALEVVAKALETGLNSVAIAIENSQNVAR